MGGRRPSMLCFAFLAALLSCSLLTVAAKNHTYVPKSVYLSLTGDLSEMQITLNTAHKPDSLYIRYWVHGSPIISSVNASTSDIVAFETPFKKTDYITSLTLTGLMPSTYYDYSISCNDNEVATYTFKTLPGKDEPIKMVMFGDLGAEGKALMNTGPGGFPYFAENHLMDFVVHFGDMAYSLASNNGKVGDTFMANIMTMSTRMPYLVAPGNHEYEQHKRSLALYKGWFSGQSKLGLASKSSDPLMFYSYDIGEKLHMISINTEVYCEDPDLIATQYHWLEQDLIAVSKRTVQPWVIVHGHRQIYLAAEDTFHSRLMRYGIQCTDSSWSSCDYTEACTSGENCGFSIEALFNKYNVNVYIAGHRHAYARMFPIPSEFDYEVHPNNLYLNPQAPTYVVSGAPGVDESNYTQILEVNKGPCVLWEKIASFSHITVHNNTHLHLQQVIVDSAKLLDEFWIVRSHSLRQQQQQRSPQLKSFKMKLENGEKKECDQ